MQHEQYIPEDHFAELVRPQRALPGEALHHHRTWLARGSVKEIEY